MGTRYEADNTTDESIELIQCKNCGERTFKLRAHAKTHENYFAQALDIEEAEEVQDDGNV